jgi:hypothetical protein
MPRGAVIMAWWAICSAMFYFFMGATLALKYGTHNALIGIAITVVVFGLINGVLAHYSVRTGLSCSALSQAMLGAAGGRLATLLLCVTAVFYAVFEGSVLAVAASTALPRVSYGLAAVIIALYSVPLVFGSVQAWLNRLNAVLLPFYLLGLVLLVGLTISRHGYSAAWLRLSATAADTSYGWWKCVAPYLGALVLSMCTVDFARFGRPNDVRFHALVTFGVPFYAMTFLVNGAIGIFLVSTIDPARRTETAVVVSSLSILGTAGGLLWIWVTQTRINTANYYLATVNFQAFMEETFGIRLSKIASAVTVGIAILLLIRSTNVFTYLLTALNYQSVFVTSWVGVALSYVLSVGKVGTANCCAFFLAKRQAGVLAWLVGAIAGALVLRFGADWSSLSAPVAMASAGLAHRVASRWR